MQTHCSAHSGHVKMMEGLEDGMKVEREERKTADADLWRAVNNIRNWIIGGMGTMIGYFMVAIIGMVFDKIKHP